MLVHKAVGGQLLHLLETQHLGLLLPLPEDRKLGVYIHGHALRLALALCISLASSGTVEHRQAICGKSRPVGGSVSTGLAACRVGVW